tara:strand:- start:172 stop:2013 length:1842 start_codon:yes stop_codon:yes gene_type:complete
MAKEQDDINYHHHGVNIGGHYITSAGPNVDDGYLGSIFTHNSRDVYDDFSFTPTASNSWNTQYDTPYQSTTQFDWIKFWRDLNDAFSHNKTYDQWWDFFDLSSSSDFPAITQGNNADVKITNEIGQYWYYAANNNYDITTEYLEAGEGVSINRNFTFPEACYGGYTPYSDEIYSNDAAHSAAFGATNFSIAQWLAMFKRCDLYGEGNLIGQQGMNDYSRGCFFRSSAYVWDNQQREPGEPDPNLCDYSNYIVNPTGGTDVVETYKKNSSGTPFPAGASIKKTDNGTAVNYNITWRPNGKVPGYFSNQSTYNIRGQKCYGYAVGCASFLFDLEGWVGGSSHKRKVVQRQPWYTSTVVAEEVRSGDAFQSGMTAAPDDVDIWVEADIFYEYDDGTQYFGYYAGDSMDKWNQQPEDACVIACGFPGLGNDGSYVLNDEQCGTYAHTDYHSGSQSVLPYSYHMFQRDDYDGGYTTVKFPFNGPWDETGLNLWDRLMAYMTFGNDPDVGWTPRPNDNSTYFRYQNDWWLFMSETDSGGDIPPLEIVFYTPIMHECAVDEEGDYEGYNQKLADRDVERYNSLDYHSNNNEWIMHPMGQFYIKNVKLVIKSRGNRAGGIN